MEHYLTEIIILQAFTFIIVGVQFIQKIIDYFNDMEEKNKEKEETQLIQKIVNKLEERKEKNEKNNIK